MRSYRGVNLNRTSRARDLRRDSTKVEKRLWHALRSRQINGLKFVRQQPIGPYFADFACREARLVVELDGSQHADSAYDGRRDTFMISQGYTVLRFWNAEVMENLDGVLQRIAAAVGGSSW